MSVIAELRIKDIRNIQSAELHCHDRLNVLFGVNGSGKTSALESAYLLSRGKSFRTANTDTLIANEAKEGVVFARLGSGKRVGLSRGRSDRTKLKLEDHVQKNWDEVAQLLPLLVIDASTFLLLEGGPKSRRQYLDWGVFHVEHSFIHHYRRFRKALANRNQLLKTGAYSAAELEAWSAHFIESGEQMHACRREYFVKLLPVFRSVYESIEPEGVPELLMTYQQGWQDGFSLAEALTASHANDRRYKATQIGPQRADIQIKTGSKLAADVLSRGQQKLVVSAMKIAQGILHSSLSQSECIYLVDDLPAELDEVNRNAVLQRLRETRAQLFVTCVQRDSLAIESNEYTAFHVERGKIMASK